MTVEVNLKNTWRRKLARRFWGCCAALLIVLALLVQLGRMLIPLADDYRPEIAQRLGDFLGVAVVIKSLDASWSGLKPSLDIRGLQWKNLAGETVLFAESANIQVDLLRTVANWRLIWTDFTVDDLELNLQQYGDQIYLQGVAPTANKDPNQSSVNPLDLLLMRGRVEFTSVQLGFTAANNTVSHWQLPSLVMENTSSFHRLTAQLKNAGQPLLKFVYEGQGDPRDKDTFLASTYLQLDNIELSELGRQLAGKAWQDFQYKALLEDTHLTGRMWLRKIPGGYLELDGRLQATSGNQILPKALQLDVNGVRTAEGAWQLGFQDIETAFEKNVATPIDVSLEFGNAEPYKIQVNSVDVGYWYQLASQKKWLPEGRLADVLASLNPQGHLDNIEVNIDAQQPSDFLFKANLRGVAANDWHGAPAVTGVDGYIQADSNGGFVELDSRDGFSMHYTTIYQDTQSFDTATGHVAWTLAEKDNAIYVNSGPITLVEGDTKAVGYMNLYTPWVAGSAPSDLTLYIALENEKVSNYPKYVPFVVGESLMGWLKQAELQGELSSGAFLYRGGLNASDSMSFTTQVALDLNNAQLSFLPEWERLKDVEARLVVDDREVIAVASKGRSGDVDIANAEVNVFPNPEIKGNLLRVTADISGSTQAGLQYLLASPIAKPLASTFETWQLSGDISGRLNLTSPLEAGVKIGRDFQVDVNFDNSALSIPELGLNVGEIQGPLKYTDKKGLFSEQLSAKLFGEKLSASIHTDKNTSVIDFNGRASTQSLALWLSEPELLIADGTFDYNTKIILPTTQLDVALDSKSSKTVSLVQIRSDLVGVTADLPEPYGKSSVQKRNLFVEIPLQAEDRVLDLRLSTAKSSDVASTSSKASDQAVQLLLDLGGGQRLNLDLNGKAVLPASGIARLSGKLAHVDIQPWFSIDERLTAAREKFAALNTTKLLKDAAIEPQERSASLNFTIDLATEKLVFLENEINDFSLQGRMTQKGWLMSGDSEQLAGSLEFIGDHMPLQLKLKHFQFPASDDTVELEELNKDKLAENKTTESITNDWDFTKLPSLDVSIDDLQYGDRALGAWKFFLQPNASDEPPGLNLTQIFGQLGDVHISGYDVESKSETGQVIGATLSWQQGDVNQTSLHAHIAFKDINQLAVEWKMPSIMESKAAHFDLNMAWPEGPWDFDSEFIEGDLDISLEEGRFFQSAGAGGNTLLRLLSVLNFDTWVRRLKLDFTDLYRDGMVFDSVEGRVEFQNQQLLIKDPIKVASPTSKLQMAGKIDWAKEELDTRLVATLPVGNNLVLAAGLLAGLPAAAGVYLINKVFSNQVDKVASVSYKMTGTWDDPQMEFDKLFDSKAAEKAGSKAAKDAVKAAVESVPAPPIGSLKNKDVIDTAEPPVADPSTEDKD